MYIMHGVYIRVHVHCFKGPKSAVLCVCALSHALCLRLYNDLCMCVGYTQYSFTRFFSFFIFHFFVSCQTIFVLLLVCELVTNEPPCHIAPRLMCVCV